MLERNRDFPEYCALEPEFVRNKLGELKVSAANRKMVEYWLTLSKDGALPCREAFDPTAASELLRGCGLFDVVPGKSVRCRIAGTVLKLIFGPNVSGQDWLALTAARHRRQRMVRYSAVAQGAIGVGRRDVFREDREPTRIEEVMLPFAGLGKGGVYQVLVHTDWRPEGEEWFGVEPTHAVTLADDFHLIRLD